MYSGCKGTLNSSVILNASSTVNFLVCNEFKLNASFSSSVNDWYFALFLIVSIHHSSHQQAPNIGWLFLRNSPNATSMSPKKRISTTFPLTFLASSMESNLRTSPDFNLTVGPSIESTGTTQLPFPGLSILSCVPTAKNSKSSIVAG